MVLRRRLVQVDIFNGHFYKPIVSFLLYSNFVMSSKLEVGSAGEQPTEEYP